jgi:hypothetical protein
MGHYQGVSVTNIYQYSLLHIINTAEPLLSGLMTGCRWPDNQKSRIIEDDPYVRLSGIFLEKVRQKTLFRTTHFRLFTRSLAIFFSGFDIRTAIRSQLRPRTESGEELHTGQRHG